MKSLRIRLISTAMAFVVALSMLIFGVWAIGSSQTITMNGNVTFNIEDDSLYIKDVKIRQDGVSEPSSVVSFMPGFINGNFDMNLTNLGDNTLGTFNLYFYIINTSDLTYEAAVTLSDELVSQGVYASLTNAIIPATTLSEDETITQDTPESVILILQVVVTSSMVLDLSGITINIDEAQPQEIAGFVFSTPTDSNGSVMAYTGAELDIVVPEGYSSSTSPLTEFTWQDSSGGSSTTEMVGIMSIYLGDYYYTPKDGERTFATSFDDFMSKFSLGEITFPVYFEPQYVLNLEAFDDFNVTLLQTYFQYFAQVVMMGYSDGDFYLTTNDGSYNNELVNLNDAEIMEIINTLNTAPENLSALFPMTCALENPLSYPIFVEGNDYVVTSVGNAAFQDLNCNSISMPSTVTSIGERAFRNCTATTIIFNSSTPPTLSTDVFTGTSASLQILVPSASVDAYKTASGWSVYANQITGF